MSGSLAGKTCLVTGGNRGIGKEIVRGLASQGAVVVMACRDEGSAARAVDELRSATGNRRIEYLLVDLSSQQSIRALAADFRRRHDALHVLVNNAGVICEERTETLDGFETTLAVNHLAYFLLTDLLVDLMTASAPSRIINMSSGAHSRARDLEDLLALGPYDPLAAYARSKLANICFTYELARRLAGTGVTANCMHPGAVRTELLDQFFGVATKLRLIRWLLSPLFVSAAQGARTACYLAASEAVAEVTGRYFVKGAARRSSSVSYDEKVADELWARSVLWTAASAG